MSVIGLCDRIRNREAKISVVGLGYVGMPIAVTFAENGIDVIGYDVNDEKIEAYRNGQDPTMEVGEDRILGCGVEFTSDEKKLKEASFYIVAVPTPVNSDHTPDLTPVEEASRIVGRNLKAGSIVVYESTVYPGVTEDVCVPILEKGSGLKCGKDFKIGYSPERINPGDKMHRFCIIIAVAHDEFKKFGIEKLSEFYGSSKARALIDVKGVFEIEKLKNKDIECWRL